MTDDAAALPPDDPYARPPGVDDATVEATGTLSEALEWVERARGHLYEFHQLMGHADLLLDDAVEGLRAAGLDDEAALVADELIGRNVLQGRWTFQIVDEFDETYWGPFREVERGIRDRHVAGRRHVFEAEMKEERRTKGRPHHARRPD